MEFLIENENELRMLAENGDYWDILHLADFLYDEKRYAEAKKLVDTFFYKVYSLL